MTSKDFVIWFKGFSKAANSYNITPAQWDTLVEELERVNDNPLIVNTEAIPSKTYQELKDELTGNLDNLVKGGLKDIPDIYSPLPHWVSNGTGGFSKTTITGAYSGSAVGNSIGLNLDSTVSTKEYPGTLTTDLPGIDKTQVIPSDPQKVTYRNDVPSKQIELLID